MEEKREKGIRKRSWGLENLRKWWKELKELGKSKKKEVKVIKKE